MKLILETTDISYYLTTSKEYYHTVDSEELIVLRDHMGCLPDWVHTLSCAERLNIVQYDDNGHRVIVGHNRTMNPFRLSKVICRF